MTPLGSVFVKKSERINQMLRFINQKKHFTFRDLMREFQISKRTALRDITALEEIGAPIYAEYGRDGGYRLLNQMQLPPISFSSQSLCTLFCHASTAKLLKFTFSSVFSFDTQKIS